MEQTYPVSQDTADRALALLRAKEQAAQNAKVASMAAQYAEGMLDAYVDGVILGVAAITGFPSEKLSFDMTAACVRVLPEKPAEPAPPELNQFPDETT